VELNNQEKYMSIKKLEEDVHKSRKENKELKKEIKELKIHNTFLLDRLEQWAERNFQERQKWMNMTIDEVLALSQSKSDYAKEKKLAREMEEVHESQFKVDSKGIA
tara:strand:- start:1340 stop:1657 length:318 start_codon:yes stop_codon:yes gene_type:complete